MQRLQETLRTKFFKGEQVDQNLPPPAQQQAVDRTGMFQAFKSRAQGGSDGCCHGLCLQRVRTGKEFKQRHPFADERSRTGIFGIRASVEIGKVQGKIFLLQRPHPRRA